MNKPRLVIASAYAAIVTIAFVVVATIWAELCVPLKDWLKNFSGHHWTSKSIFSVLLYIIATLLFYAVLRKVSEKHLHKALTSLLISLGLGIVILTAFYTGHHLELF